MPKGDFLGEFEIYVMLALHRLGDDAYGIRIRQEITECTGREVVIGAVYATLSRLEGKGLVGYHVAAPQPVPGGRARKCFRLTRSGERALAHSTAMMTRMIRGWRPRTENR
jgi:DNA-binding PadR family transcriptional regulator